jgi:hypothetical protein
MNAVCRQESFQDAVLENRESSYEIERSKRVERNRNFLRQIWSRTLETSEAEWSETSEQAFGKHASLCVPVSIRQDLAAKNLRSVCKVAEVKLPSTPQKPVRRSERKRTRGRRSSTAESTGYLDQADCLTKSPNGTDNPEANTEDENVSTDELFDMERYFTEIAPQASQSTEPLRVDGHFRGWVNPEVAERWGIASNSMEAWNANGGGRFSYRNPLGTTNGGTRRAQLPAKEIARRSLQKNPNAYFYRHNEPGEEQWFGDWSAEEIERFVEVARRFGCGDKWGLFASYIPHRVGYQCSSAYREIILPAGMIYDPNYAITSNGKAIYIGRHWHGARRHPGDRPDKEHL